jgi:large subunit ribosomal protein L14
MKGARLGDTIMGSVNKEAQPRGKGEQGRETRGLRAAMNRGGKGELIGSRVFGPVPRQLGKMKHLNIVSSLTSFETMSAHLFFSSLNILLL